MKKVFNVFYGAVFSIIVSIGTANAGEIFVERLQQLIRNRIEAAGAPIGIESLGERIHAVGALPKFYESRAFEPAWLDGKAFSEQATFLINALKSASKEGLNPKDYHLDAIESAIHSIDAPSNQKPIDLESRIFVDIELLLTDAFLVYASHLLSGKVNPESFDTEWVANRRGADMSEVLSTALASGRVDGVLMSLRPKQKGYWRLREALREYSSVAEVGGWPTVPSGKKLKKGDRDKRVVLLRSRLEAIKNWNETFEPNVAEIFDQKLEEQVLRFQINHGLAPDGVVGPATLVALNVPAQDRVRQIEMNLERWRWLPENLGDSHVIVNIPDFKLQVVEKDQTILEMKIIVGREYRRTPVFSDRITYMVLNPTWHVPRNIAVKDKLPLIKKNPRYLAENNIKLLQGWGAQVKPLNPEEIDWSNVSPKNFPYRLHQSPGPDNALGRIKFMFPNRFNVYLHDTPSKDLFEKPTRTFSSGCIRIQRPDELAFYLMRGIPGWDRETLDRQLSKNIEQTIPLPFPTPVHLLYWTAFVIEDGEVQFRHDIYGRDKRLGKAMLP